MATSPLNTIKKGAFGILEKGKDFFKDQNTGGIIKNSIKGVTTGFDDTVQNLGYVKALKKNVTPVIKAVGTSVGNFAKDQARLIDQGAKGQVNVTGGDLRKGVLTTAQGILSGGKSVLQGTVGGVMTIGKTAAQPILGKQNTQRYLDGGELEKKLIGYNTKPLQEFAGKGADAVKAEGGNKFEQALTYGALFAGSLAVENPGNPFKGLFKKSFKNTVEETVENISKDELRYYAKQTDEALLAKNIKIMHKVPQNVADELATLLAPTQSIDEVKQVLVNYGKQSNPDLATQAFQIAEKKSAGTLKNTPVTSNVAPEIPADVRTQMKTFVDYVNDKTAGKDLELEFDVVRIAEDYGLIDTAKRKTKRTLANLFSDELYKYDGNRAILTEKPALKLDAEYKGEKDLTTKILKDLEGKSTVSKQYILDATNRGELKQVERDLIRQVLDESTPKGEKVLHGTGVKFDSFDDSMRGSLTGAKSAKGAIWFTDDQATAKAYSVYSAEEGVVKKALAEADVLEKIAQRSGKDADWKKYDAKVVEYEELGTYDNSHNRRKEANVKEAYIDGDLYEVDAKGKSPQELSKEGDIDSWLNEQIEKAKKLGKDGVKIKNLDDAVGLYDRPATHYAIFDSKKINTSSDTINVSDFAKKVKAELLPLKVKDTVMSQKEAVAKLKEAGYTIDRDMSGDANILNKNGNMVDYDELPRETQKIIDGALGNAQSYGDIGKPKYENIVLPDELRGKVKNYKENIYESPIKTSAGGTHFSGQTDNYFGHTRIEDMADNQTRRVIEVQSDLYQKGNLEGEKGYPKTAEYQGKEYVVTNVGNQYVTLGDISNLGKPRSSFPAIKEVKVDDVKFNYDQNRVKEIAKLQQYNDPTAHFRMVREEIKKAAQDGKTKLQFPTGETAMKIEGLGQAENSWRYIDENQFSNQLFKDKLKTGLSIDDGHGNDWIITDVLGDGKFKAVSKGQWSERHNFTPETLERNKEQFDISGKVDTSNPIYKFYEKDVQKYLNKFDGKRIVDDKGVSWVEIPIKKEMASSPVDAFKFKNSDIKYDATADEIKAGFRKIFGRDIGFDEVVDAQKELGNKNALGGVVDKTIKLLRENDSFSKVVANHEGYHWFKRTVVPVERMKLNQLEKDLMKAVSPERIQSLKKAGYADDVIPEELMADEFARYYRTGKTILEKAQVFFDKMTQRLKLIFSKRNDVLSMFQSVKKTLNKGLDTSKTKTPSRFFNNREPSRVDQLIADGKVRVVSRDSRDIYQYKKGNEWVNARDEDSIVKRFDEKPRTEVQEKREMLTDLIKNTEERIKEHPGKSLQRYESKKEGQLLDNNKNFAKTAEKLDVKAFDNPDEAIRLIDEYREIKSNLADYKAQRVNLPKTSSPVKSPIQSIVAQSKNPALSSQNVDVPKLQSTGEARSLQEVANQRQLESYSDVPSLMAILDNTQTNVKSKVNIWDTFMRTPIRVLEKIGLKKQGELILKKYDDYQLELPKNIQKITDWSKQVPKESNERIFKWLDGQAIDLRADELKVGNEIKVWLKEWADRLGLPNDNRIAEYITHIFDDQLIKKEFDEDLAKIIKDKIPGEVYNGFLEKRLGAKGYKQDTWAALDAYVKRGTRKVHMDEALEQIEIASSKLEDSQWTYVKKFIDNVNLRPNDFDTSVDNLIKSTWVGYKAGQRPFTSWTRGLRRIVSRGAFGLNIGTALRNLSQVANTTAKMGYKDTGLGYLKLFSKQNQKEMIEQGIFNSGFVQDKVLNATKKTIERMDKGLFIFMEAGERINRGAAYMAAKTRGLRKGMSEAESITYAKKIVSETQFKFGTVDIPVGQNSDLIKTLTQFQSYTTKQIEFLTEMAKNKEYAGLLRYAVTGFAFVYTIGEIFGMKPEELIPMIRFQAPPTLQVPTEIIKAGLNTPDKYGSERTGTQKLKDIGNAAKLFIPASSQAKKTIEANKVIKNGGSFDKGGNLQFEVPKENSLQARLFGKYATDEGQEYIKKLRQGKKSTKNVEKIYKDIQVLKESNPDEAIAQYDALSEDEKKDYQKHKTSLAKKAILPTFQAIRAMRDEGKTDEAIVAYDALSEEQQKAYQSVKKQTETIQKNTDKIESERTLVELIASYAKAYTIDPANAFKAMTTKEKLGKVEGNLVGFERFFGNDFRKTGGSEEYVAQLLKEMGIPQSERSNYNLEHIVPITAGGDNSPENLKIVDRATHDSWTEVDIAIGKALKTKKINRRRAEKLAVDFKSGAITKVEVYEQLK